MKPGGGGVESAGILVRQAIVDGLRVSFRESQHWDSRVRPAGVYSNNYAVPLAHQIPSIPAIISPTLPARR